MNIIILIRPITKLFVLNSILYYILEKMTEFKYISEITKITNHLYLSGDKVINSIYIKNYNITNIINLTLVEYKPEILALLKGYLHINEYDSPTTNLYKYFDTTFKFIDSAIQRNENVLVHCQMGVSRSATIIIVYLMKKYNWTKDTAFKYVSIKRPIINPNDGFRKQLVTWENDLLLENMKINSNLIKKMNK